MYQNNSADLPKGWQVLLIGFLYECRGIEGHLEGIHDSIKEAVAPFCIDSGEALKLAREEGIISISKCPKGDHRIAVRANIDHPKVRSILGMRGTVKTLEDDLRSAARQIDKTKEDALLEEAFALWQDRVRRRTSYANSTDRGPTQQRGKTMLPIPKEIEIAVLFFLKKAGRKTYENRKDELAATLSDFLGYARSNPSHIGQILVDMQRRGMIALETSVTSDTIDIALNHDNPNVRDLKQRLAKDSALADRLRRENSIRLGGINSGGSGARSKPSPYGQTPPSPRVPLPPPPTSMEPASPRPRPRMEVTLTKQRLRVIRFLHVLGGEYSGSLTEMSAEIRITYTALANLISHMAADQMVVKVMPNPRRISSIRLNYDCPTVARNGFHPIAYTSSASQTVEDEQAVDECAAGPAVESSLTENGSVAEEPSNTNASSEDTVTPQGKRAISESRLKLIQYLDSIGGSFSGTLTDLASKTGHEMPAFALLVHSMALGGQVTKVMKHARRMERLLLSYDNEDVRKIIMGRSIEPDLSEATTDGTREASESDSTSTPSQTPRNDTEPSQEIDYRRLAEELVNVAVSTRLEADLGEIRKKLEEQGQILQFLLELLDENTSDGNGRHFVDAEETRSLLDQVQKT